MTNKTKHKYEVYVRSGDNESTRLAYFKNGSIRYNVNSDSGLGAEIVNEDKVAKKIVGSAKGLLKKLELNELKLKVEFKGIE
jgi:hypothetical protein